MQAFNITDGTAAIRDVPKPELQPRQMLVKVHAAGLNRVDLLTAQAMAGGQGAGQSVGLGRELCGTVVEVGAEVQQFRQGDVVIAMTAGALAEYAAVDERTTFKAPLATLSEQEAAVLPLALNTMHDAVVTRGELRQGQSVLIQGASSAVGIMAMQIARELGASLVIGTSRDQERRARLTDHGADVAVDTGDDGWVDAVLDATGGAGVDMLIDQIGAPVANANLRATRLEGRIINVGRLGGNTGEFDFDLHAARRITYIGVTFRTRTADEVEAIAGKAWEQLSPAIDAGRLRLPISARYPLEQADQALDAMARDQHFGKIVVTVD